MRDRVKEILSLDVMEQINQKEREGHSKYNLISLMVVHSDRAPREILEEYSEEKVNVTAYQNMLIIAIMTEMEIKEEVADLRQLLIKAQKESEE